MTNTASRNGKHPPAKPRGRLSRIARIAAGGLAVLPALASPVAMQDMTSLIEGRNGTERWQAFFVPAPAGSIQAATLAFAGAVPGIPDGAGVQAGTGAVYAVDTVRPDFDTPDEARIARKNKTGRVIAVVQAAPMKIFAAEAAALRQSLLRPAALDWQPRLAGGFSRPQGGGTLLASAARFEPPRAHGSAAPGAESQPAVMLASLQVAPPKPASLPKVATLPKLADAPKTGADTPVTALGYAPVASLRAATPFDRVLNAAPDLAAPSGFIPPIGAGDHAWAATPLPLSAYSAKEQTCLANGIYFEARGESATGQAAVAQVILNRVRNPSYPKTICGVVYQNKSWRNRCQFSFACDGRKDRITNKRAYARARHVADQVTSGEIWLADVGSATHYHATYVRPRWAKAMEKVDKIGRHIFYRTFNGGWN